MRINWFSPLPPARSGIAADYTSCLLPALSAKAEVILWTDQEQCLPSLERYAEVRRFSVNPDRAELGRAAATFFNIGNSAQFHRTIWQACRQYPGIAILHDVSLHDAIIINCRISPALSGVFPDGWTSGCMTVSFGPGKARHLHMKFGAEGIPEKIPIRLVPNPGSSGEPDVYYLIPGSQQSITRKLPDAGGTLEFLISPTFQPAQQGSGDDVRILGCRLESAAITGPDGDVLLRSRAAYLDIMQSTYGDRGRRDAELHWNGILSLDQMSVIYPCAQYVLPLSLAAVVHSRAAERILARERKLPVMRIPLPFSMGRIPTAHAGPPPWRLIVFGFLGPNRCLDRLLAALGSQADRSLFHLHIYGEMHDPEAVVRQVSELQLENSVTVHGFVPEAELDTALAEAHLAINLRYPTKGEASGSQLRIWSQGLPSIVTRTGWYRELPEGIVAFVHVESMVEDLGALLHRYATAPEYFRQMGTNSYRYFIERHSPQQYAAKLLELADQVSRRSLRNPSPKTRRSSSDWPQSYGEAGSII